MQSILTFGGGTDAVNPTVQQNGISEELRDEKLNQKLMDAYRKKQAGQYLEALQVYTSVLEDEFLKDAKIEKHVFMRYNAHKNSGEAYEKTNNYPLAKYHYTQVSRLDDVTKAHKCFCAGPKNPAERLIYLDKTWISGV